MSFFNEVIIKLGLSPENCVGGDKVTIYDGIGVFVEGHFGVHSYNQERIELRLKKENLLIDGLKLKIVEINDTEIYITGKILAVSRGKNG